MPPTSSSRSTGCIARRGGSRSSSRRYDLWLTPTLAQPPLPIGHFEIESGDVDRWIGRLAAFIPFTYPFNITGQPAASVPLYWTADGVPIGCQFVARYGDEATLLRIGAQLELARPWFDRRPPRAQAAAR